jgi:hypothetical protein
MDTTRIVDLPELDMNTQRSFGAPPPGRFEETPPNRLPGHDIPMVQTNYQQDESVQPNYIPKSNIDVDFVKQHEEITHQRIQQHETAKRRMSLADTILTNLQTPILVALLFFIFQLPIFNTMIYKRFTFLSIHDTDGNINMMGILMKSILFGTAFYSLSQSIEFLSVQ